MILHQKTEKRLGIQSSSAITLYLRRRCGPLGHTIIKNGISLRPRRYGMISRSPRPAATATSSREPRRPHDRWPRREAASSPTRPLDFHPVILRATSSASNFAKLFSDVSFTRFKYAGHNVGIVSHSKSSQRRRLAARPTCSSDELAPRGRPAVAGCLHACSDQRFR